MTISEDLSRDPDTAEVLDRAAALLDDAVRADPTRWQPLVHPDFLQVGFGGSEVPFAQLGEHLKPLRGSLRAEVLSCERLADDVILVRWRGTTDGGVVSRGAVWLRTPGGWQLRYQQGTKIR